MDEEIENVNPSLHVIEFIRHDNLQTTLTEIVESKNAREASRVNFYPIGKAKNLLPTKFLYHNILN
jgi:hypothetical protein